MSSPIDSSRLRAITGSITFSSKLPEAPAKVIGGVVADHLGADLEGRLGDHRVDLAGHDARPGLEVLEVDLGQAGRRAAAHPAQVVADLHQPDGVGLERAAELDQGVLGALGLEVVRGLGERLAGVVVEVADGLLRRTPAGC